MATWVVAGLWLVNVALFAAWLLAIKTRKG